LLTLDTQTELQEDKKVRLRIEDDEGSTLFLQAILSSKTAGFRVIFYVTNCLINSSPENLFFFYEKPSKEEYITKSDQEIKVSTPQVIVSDENDGCSELHEKTKKVHMLSTYKEIFAKIEKSEAISEPVHIFTPGTHNRFQLTRGNKLYEFGYSTELYLANRDEFIYTRVTTISPFFIVVNLTQSTVAFA